MNINNLLNIDILYNTNGTQWNTTYNIDEIFNDFGEDGCFDEYEDGSGIDAGASTNETLVSATYY